MINQRYGIVQGRLVDSEDGELQSFPNANWEKEFEIAKKTKLSFIELLAERKYKEETQKRDKERKKQMLIVILICARYIFLTYLWFFCGFCKIILQRK